MSSRGEIGQAEVRKRQRQSSKSDEIHDPGVMSTNSSQPQELSLGRICILLWTWTVCKRPRHSSVSVSSRLTAGQRRSVFLGGPLVEADSTGSQNYSLLVWKPSRTCARRPWRGAEGGHEETGLSSLVLIGTAARRLALGRVTSSRLQLSC